MNPPNLDAPLAIIPGKVPVRGQVRLPPSKSVSNRAIHLASMASGTSILKDVLVAQDTDLMIAAWGKLGASIGSLPDAVGSDLLIQGTGGCLVTEIEKIEVGNAGTVARFILPLLCLWPRDGVVSFCQIDGTPPMRQRPIGDLIRALGSMGASIRPLGQDASCFPLEISRQGLRGRSTIIAGHNSSQYLSALLMAAPLIVGLDEIKVAGELVSRPYVDITMKMMADFGVDTFWQCENSIHIPQGQSYQAREYRIEGDASSASYFFAMAAITGGEIRVCGVSPGSLQGDLKFLDVLAAMGCAVSWQEDAVTVRGTALLAVDVDMKNMSDVAPTLAICALFATGKTIIRGIANLRIKECDRISALVTELRKVGADVEEWEDGVSIEVKGSLKGAILECYEDHRMAMAFSLIGLKIAGIVILDPACVAKTFPNYFREFLRLSDAQP